ncbi:hypothetical protein ANCCAN_21142 [Ancylostoma caninum]|uniref:Receptor ligand binding region domain-containing protein n=1 Tax=Ancylostoma caninum TaxID=29170 RepID=A0A368FLD5_ANCCA|nr:hypothetical protein ANCCAN_21142 [Ancylostoma caninum]
MALLETILTSKVLPIAAMANFWNIPTIAYISTDNVLSSKWLNRTLIRVARRSISAIAESTVAFIKHYKWNEVSLVTNIGTSAYEKVAAFETVLKRQGITITRKILFEESVTSHDMLSGGQMEEIKQNSKIVIVLFSSSRDLNAVFREASRKYGLSEGEFIFIFPWLQEQVYGSSPIAGTNDNSLLEKVKQTYSSCVLVSLITM